MVESNIVLESYLRVLTLSNAQQSVLKESELKYEQGKHFKTGMPNAIFDLDKCNINILQAFIEKAGIESHDMDIFLSFRTSYSNRIIRVPNSAKNAIKVFNCEVNISYTIS